MYEKIAHLIWERYIEGYIVSHPDSSNNIIYCITDTNNVIKSNRNTTYTLNELVDSIDNNHTKYILLSYIKQKCYQKHNYDMIFTISDIISESWNLIMIEIKKIIFNSKI
jgi:hypothetical protein